MARYLEIKDYFDFCLKKDSFCKNGSYPVSTIYYDTPALEFFHDKVNGEYIHKKARLRTYGETMFEGPTFFEIKAKSNEDQIKKRIKLEKRMSLMDIPDFASFKDSEISQQLEGYSLVPVSHVKYDREAYFLGEGDGQLRVNFDKNISISEVNESHRFETLVFPDQRILLEVKMPFRGTNQIINSFLSLCQEQRTTFSKYATGMNLISSNYAMETPNEL